MSNMWYRIVRWQRQTMKDGQWVEQAIYHAEWRRGVYGRWHLYYDGTRDTWEGAYAVLKQHATPAVLAVRFVGTH